jgi:hypothetical protein
VVSPWVVVVASPATVVAASGSRVVAVSSPPLHAAASSSAAMKTKNPLLARMSPCYPSLWIGGLSADRTGAGDVFTDRMLIGCCVTG